MEDTVLKNAFAAVNWLKTELESLCNYDVIVYNGATTRNGSNVDGIVVFNHMQVAIIQFSSTQEDLPYIRREAGKLIKGERIPIGIVVNNKGDLYIKKRDNSRFKSTGILTVAKTIQDEYGTYRKALDKEVIKERIMSMFDFCPSFTAKNNVRKILDEGCESLIIDGGLVYLKKEYEDRLFIELLGGKDNEMNSVCRYTSLNSLFHLLNSQKHAMCSPVSMNDPHECDYADSLMPWYVKRARGEQEIEIDNSYFLLSCSNILLSDELTMWRLYGDNAKGVCIEYEIDFDKIDNEHYFLAPVSYGKKNGGHPELEFIAHMQVEPIEAGWHFSFNRWFIWKFFFKSADYADEREIRLIYIPDWDEEQGENVKWYIDASNCIFNRMALLPIGINEKTTFPLLISKIILGPNSPESSKNMEQISFMVDTLYPKTTARFCATRSRINSYR